MTRRQKTLLVAFSIAAVWAGVVLLGVQGVIEEHSPPENGRNLLTIAAPAHVLSFELVDSRGEVLWKIQAAAPTELTRLRYGEVPQGFQQAVPPRSQRPRLLIGGEALVTVTVTDSRIFRHKGEAAGPDGFLGGVWESSGRSD